MDNLAMNKAEVERLRKENEQLRGSNEWLLECLWLAAKKTSGYRAALEYYGDLGNYIKFTDVFAPIIKTADGSEVDNGRTARAALGE
jgi:hypothetical protein